MPALFEAIGRLDVAVFQWLRRHDHPLLDTVMAGISDLARAGALWIGLGFLIALASPSRWKGVVQLLLAIGLAVMLTDHVAKPYFNRQRPFEHDAAMRVYGYKPTTRSMPSGHAVNAVVGAYTLTRIFPEGRIIFWILAALVSLSRVYLGVHYPADVAVGCVMGLAIAQLAVGSTRWRQTSAVSEVSAGVLI
jgi:undecaprenyl-diphosphatase